MTIVTTPPENPDLIIYCDGSGTAKREAGGVGFIAIRGSITRSATEIEEWADIGAAILEGSCSWPSMTNQTAELSAAAYALEQVALRTYPVAQRVLVKSDSRYVVDGMNKWLPNWVQWGWTTGLGGDVKNIPEWKRLLAACHLHGQVGFSWIRGHDGNLWNEHCDRLASAARLEALAATAP